MRTIYSADGPEISDLLVEYDALTLERKHVYQQAVVDEFRKYDNSMAVKIVQALKTTGGGILDENTVDQLLIKAHCEMQRLSEEFYHGNRVKDLLAPLIKTLRESGHQQPIRIIDIGCGTGYVVRWLAKYGDLGDDVAVLGVDLNKALINEANRLAAEESIKCQFMHANAFTLAEPATIFITTGVLHHFSAPESLTRFFGNHRIESVQAFFHFDFQPNILAPLGSWLFHIMRMREPLCWHDGVLSAARAHQWHTLVECARNGADGFLCGMYARRFWQTPLPRVFQTLVGIRPSLNDQFRRNLGVFSMQMDVLK
jgi:2-polyprenyl-3-methyl-5-hydroxy-6-metoxy-1,4-benzoquinol methylase